MEQSLKPKVTLLFGRICSGKGSYLKEADKRIIVSDVVKSIVNSSNRDALQNSLHFDILIAERILSQIYEYRLQCSNQEPHIVIDGIRQVSIVNTIRVYFPEAEIVWLEVPTEERKRRYEARKDVKDVEPFEIADNKPIELECQKIFDTFKERLTIINNY